MFRLFHLVKHLPADSAFCRAEGVGWADGEALLAALVHEQRIANWLTVLTNTEGKSDRKRLVSHPPEPIVPPGQQAPAPKRRRRGAPLSPEAVEAATGGGPQQ